MDYAARRIVRYGRACLSTCVLRRPAPILRIKRVENPVMKSIAPKARGLYDPKHEHDACGIGAVVDISGTRSHKIVEYGKQILLNLQHRGAAGADESTGDGAGILMQLPHDFLAAECDRLGIALPRFGCYGAASVFLPRDAALRARCEAILTKAVEAEGMKVLGWRDVPCDNRTLGEIARLAEPVVRQLFIGGEGLEDVALERRLYLARKKAERRARVVEGIDPDLFYIPSMSCADDRSTRGCSWPRSCSPIIPTWPIRG